MNLSAVLDLVRDQEAYRQTLSGLPPRGGRSALGLIRSARALAVAALAKDTRATILYVAPRQDIAIALVEQLAVWLPALRVLPFAEPGPLFYERIPWGRGARQDRITVLAELASGAATGAVIVATTRSLMQRTLTPDAFENNCMTLETGVRVPGENIDGLLRRWIEIGYEPASVVTRAGQFSRRGGILDIFPVAGSNPVRIELWGDDIETLRCFDPATQLSLHPVEHVEVTPAREALPAQGPQTVAQLSDWFRALTRDETSDSDGDLLRDADALAQGRAFPALEFYLAWMTGHRASLADYLPDQALVIMDDLDDIVATAADLEYQALDLRQSGEQAGDIPPDMPVPLATWAELEDDLARFSVVDLSGSPAEGSPLGDLFAPGPRFAGELRRLLENVREDVRGGQSRVIVVSRQAERLAELWRDHTGGSKPSVHDVLAGPPAPGSLAFVQGVLGDGWVMQGSDGDVLLYSDAEIFGWKRPEPRRRVRPQPVSPETFFADLTEGDYVVHVEYGIGRFIGLEVRSLGGVDREFLLLSYAGADVLYVPIYQADRISRYVGPDDADPALSRLGTAEWNRAKERARQAAEELARDLLDLYAAREAVSGRAFSPDTAWQHELEASFPYVETDDQLRALAEVKDDMQKPIPMDRLICGDVGYGKTEVALRAAFKAVMDGTQVAMLVPTTVLAQQHFETFSQRLAPFPVQVEMLSRFRTRGEQDAVVRGLAAGQVDIVIGTHRLLGDDVAFKNLGLLIIDEEQRFGVTHKEHFKRLRTEVDVLTLTATPIPRTLYLSLTGVRDISIIDTAPEERRPIATHVGRRDEDLIRQAVLRELDRGGQVFFVHNRVQTIYAEADRLRRLLPEARIGIGHGQMSEHDLEAIMEQFTAGAIDLLVSTSIIEAGLDIPNANTLIVDRADRFGLSQLYQLRGRVGRSAARAYAYFFHAPLHSLTPEARARLETIAENTQLGAGMNIALRDMEIRGAGEILGARQHGQIGAVGFHLYTRLLTQAVNRLRENRSATVPTGPQRQQPIVSPLDHALTIDLPIPTYIPPDYVPDMALRIQLYRRMADVQDEAEINTLLAELADRFGTPPPPVENLATQLLVKLLSLRAGIDAVVSEGGQLSLRMRGLEVVDRQGLQRRLGHNVRVSKTAIWLAKDDPSWLPAVISILKSLGDDPPVLLSGLALEATPDSSRISLPGAS